MECAKNPTGCKKESSIRIVLSWDGEQPDQEDNVAPIFYA